jgi:DNA polymerase-3 subunit alpha
MPDKFLELHNGIGKRMSKSLGFCHLHGHTEFSLLDGYSKIPKMIERVKAIGQTSLAITDHGSLSGAHKFYTLCKQNDINPIVGYEGYFCTDRRLKDTAHRQTFHFILLALNKDGFKNLLKIASEASTGGFYYKPRIDLALLKQYNKGLICTTACMASMFNQLLLAKNIDAAKGHLLSLQEIFGKRLYIEVQDHGIPEQHIILQESIKCASDLDIPLVATNDYHYVNPEDAHYQDILFCDQLKTELDNPDRLKLNQHFYIKTREEMELTKLPQVALDNTLLIAEQCDLTLGKAKYVFPSFENAEAKFDRMIADGIEERFEFLPNEEYAKRLDEEIQIIKDANLLGYFLTVADYIQWAKNNGVTVGPGRGSVAGSLLAYILKIHDVDPIKYKLLFSRFYNSGRKSSLPDIDTDFAESDITKVIQYLVDKYGIDKVAAIGTFQKVAGRGAIKLVCRVNKIPFDLANQYSALVDSKKHRSLAEAFDSHEFKQRYEQDAQFKQIVDEAQQVEDTAVSQGVHAAGIVVADVPLQEIIPIRKDKNTELFVTSWDMEDVEATGLIKFDFLSLSTLDVIKQTIELAKLGCHYLDLPLDDEKAYDLISNSNNTGIFQLSSTGISSLANQMQVRSIEDIAKVVALYRPGPLESGLDKVYLLRRFGQEPVEYLHEKCKPALESTLGVLIFQEQVTRLCMDLALFSEEEADELRKMMGKKLIEKEGGKAKMQKIGNSFVKKCLENGIGKGVAEEIWEQMNKFGSYGFNLSHATSYGLLTYYTAYLKAHHPLEFMTACLNTSIGKLDKIKAFLTECKNMGIEIIPPRYNHSGRFTCKDGTILFGLGAIKGLGISSCEKINGTYADFISFCLKIRPETDILIAIIEAGALDGLGYSRRSMLETAETLMKEIRSFSSRKNPSQKSLFSTKFDFKVPKLPEFPDSELAAMEFDRIGTYLRLNPLLNFQSFADQFTVIPNDNEIPYNQVVRVLCVPIKIKKFVTKTSNRNMAIANCETLGSSVELLVFPKAYEEFKSKLSVGRPILVHGKVVMGERFSLAADNIDYMT